MKILDQLHTKTSDYNIVETIQYLAKEFTNEVVFSTSLGQEDQVITELIKKSQAEIEIFTLDTGRLFQETYDILERTQKKYNLQIKSYFPDQKSVENLINSKGPNSFYTSVENRKECCSIRKINPLKRALKGNKIWITGLRAAQSTNRKNMKRFEYDSNFNIIKYNPLIDWTLKQVNEYSYQNNIPQNSLHQKGFISIGCAPCTRAIEKNEDIRAGRWWWESSHKECGLHASKTN